MAKFMEEKGISPEYTVPYKSYMNGRAECAIKVLTSITRCLLRGGRLAKSMWLGAMCTAAYLRRSR